MSAYTFAMLWCTVGVILTLWRGEAFTTEVAKTLHWFPLLIVCVVAVVVSPVVGFASLFMKE